MLHRAKRSFLKPPYMKCSGLKEMRSIQLGGSSFPSILMDNTVFNCIRRRFLAYVQGFAFDDAEPVLVCLLQKSQD